MLQPRPVELRLERFSLPPLPLVADGAAVAMDALIDNFFLWSVATSPGRCYIRWRGMLQPTSFFVGTNQRFCR